MKAEARFKKRVVRWNKTPRGWGMCEDEVWMEDWISQSPSTHIEELFYERCRALAERATGQNVTVGIAFDRTQEDSVNFRAMLCGVFRASVYGRLSVMIRGCVTLTDLFRVKQEIVRAFCDLERDGREFNGYIARGVLIESPILLFSSQIADGMDFICLDSEKWEIECLNRSGELWWLTSLALPKGEESTFENLFEKISKNHLTKEKNMI